MRSISTTGTRQYICFDLELVHYFSNYLRIYVKNFGASVNGALDHIEMLSRQNTEDRPLRWMICVDKIYFLGHRITKRFSTFPALA